METLYNNGDEFFLSMLAEMAEAQKTLFLETYIFEEDQLGLKVINILKERAQKGVEVRLLIDGMGSPFWGRKWAPLLEKAGVKVRIFHPLPWNFRHWRFMPYPGSVLGKFFRLWGFLNRRNHRKVCIIDERVAFVGSFNISAVHLSVGADWRDTGIRIEDERVKWLERIFFKSFINPFYFRQHIFLPKNAGVLLNSSVRLRRKRNKQVLRRINQATQKIWITNAYFNPDKNLLKSLMRAAQKGKDVRIILPAKSDIFFTSWSGLVFYQSLLKGNVRLFEYEKSVLHAKTLIVDDWMIVGSSNFNYRSFFHDLEVDVVIKSQKIKQELMEFFMEDLKKSSEVKLQDLGKRPWYHYFLGKLVLIFKFWM